MGNGVVLGLGRALQVEVLYQTVRKTGRRLAFPNPPFRRVCRQTPSWFVSEPTTTSITSPRASLAYSLPSSEAFAGSLLQKSSTWHEARSDGAPTRGAPPTFLGSSGSRSFVARSDDTDDAKADAAAAAAAAAARLFANCRFVILLVSRTADDIVVLGAI